MATWWKPIARASRRSSGSVPREMRSRLSPAAGMAVGVVAGLVVALIVLVAGWEPARETHPFRTDPAAVRGFLDAWRRSRTATYRLEVRFHRTVEGRSGID